MPIPTEKIEPQMQGIKIGDTVTYQRSTYNKVNKQTTSIESPMTVMDENKSQWICNDMKFWKYNGKMWGTAKSKLDIRILRRDTE